MKTSLQRLIAIFVCCSITTAVVHASQKIDPASEFSSTMFESLSQENKDKNIVYSPYSIREAFKMAAIGAKGSTLSEINSVLGLPGAKESPLGSDSIVSVSNRLWVQNGFTLESSYLKQCKSELGAEPGIVDFGNASEAMQTINSWVQTKTSGKIKNLIQDLGKEVKLVLTNAIYFKGKWENAFPHENTHPKPFNLVSGASVSVPFMSKIMTISYQETKQAQIAQMPYQLSEKNRYAMTIVLPKKNVKLSEVEDIEPIFTSTRVAMNIPKFDFGSSFSLKSELQKLGVNKAFTPDADFSGIDGKQDLYINTVIHKAMIKVDEDGTEAAAATAITMAKSMAVMRQDPPVEFLANKPFLFYISELNTGKILFMGKVSDPSQKN